MRLSTYQLCISLNTEVLDLLNRKEELQPSSKCLVKGIHHAIRLFLGILLSCMMKLSGAV